METGGEKGRVNGADRSGLEQDQKGTRCEGGGGGKRLPGLEGEWSGQDGGEKKELVCVDA
jgi:hypothetical protein